MTPPQFVHADLTADGLTLGWANVSIEDAGFALRLSITAISGDGSTL